MAFNIDITIIPFVVFIVGDSLAVVNFELFYLIFRLLFELIKFPVQKRH